MCSTLLWSQPMPSGRYLASSRGQPDSMNIGGPTGHEDTEFRPDNKSGTAMMLET